MLDINFLNFSGGERHVQLPEFFASPVTPINVEARLYTSEDVIDLLLLVNALRYRFGSDLEINLLLPYLPYARQDRVCAVGQAFSLEVFAGLLTSMNLMGITVWDCHSDIGLQLTGAKNVTAEKIIASSSDLVNLLKAKNSVLVCPDEGAKTRCLAIKESLSLDVMIQCDKKRDPVTGKITKTEIECENLLGKTAIITDDICDGGFTFIKIAEQLKRKGVEKIVLYVTHGIFSKGFDVFDGLIDEIYTTDSFNQNRDITKLNVINY